MPTQSKKGGGARKIGRNKDKCLKYRTFHTREKNKLKRIRRSNGYEAGLAYAKECGLTAWYQKTFEKPAINKLQSIQTPYREIIASMKHV